jgi:hypothetical protein
LGLRTLFPPPLEALTIFYIVCCNHLCNWGDRRATIKGNPFNAPHTDINPLSIRNKCFARETN